MVRQIAGDVCDATVVPATPIVGVRVRLEDTVGETAQPARSENGQFTCLGLLKGTTRQRARSAALHHRHFRSRWRRRDGTTSTSIRAKAQPRDAVAQIAGYRGICTGEFTSPPPIVGIGTSTAAFAGTAESRPIESPTQLGNCDGLSAATIEADAAVLTGTPARLPSRGCELLAKHPWMHVVAIRSDGCATSMYELRPFERELGEISPASLLDAVRGAAPAGA
jgi:hypothetical protein